MAMADPGAEKAIKQDDLRILAAKATERLLPHKGKLKRQLHSRVPEIDIQVGLVVHCRAGHANDMLPRREPRVQPRVGGKEGGRPEGLSARLQGPGNPRPATGSGGPRCPQGAGRRERQQRRMVCNRGLEAKQKESEEEKTRGRATLNHAQPHEQPTTGHKPLSGRRRTPSLTAVWGRPAPRLSVDCPSERWRFTDKVHVPDTRPSLGTFLWVSASGSLPPPCSAHWVPVTQTPVLRARPHPARTCHLCQSLCCPHSRHRLGVPLRWPGSQGIFPRAPRAGPGDVHNVTPSPERRRAHSCVCCSQALCTMVRRKAAFCCCCFFEIQGFIEVLHEKTLHANPRDTFFVVSWFDSLLCCK